MVATAKQMVATAKEMVATAKEMVLVEEHDCRRPFAGDGEDRREALQVNVLAGHQKVELHVKERATSFIRERHGRQRLAGARRARQQHAPARRRSATVQVWPSQRCRHALQILASVILAVD